MILSKLPVKNLDSLIQLPNLPALLSRLEEDLMLYVPEHSEPLNLFISDSLS